MREPEPAQSPTRSPRHCSGGRGRTIMTIRAACLAAVPAIFIVASSALAQATLTEGQILNSLAGAGEAAAAVGVDIAAVQRAIEDGIRKEGGTNAVAPPPALQALAMLPNLTVEILF